MIIIKNKQVCQKRNHFKRGWDPQNWHNKSRGSSTGLETPIGKDEITDPK